MPPSAFRITLAGLVSLALAMGVGRFAFTPLLPMMQDDGLAGIAEGGWLASAHFLAYWIGAISAAAVPLAPKAVLRLSLLAIAAATLGMGLTDSFLLWLPLRAVAGVCSAWTLVVVSNYAVKHLQDTGKDGLQGWIFSGVGAGMTLVGVACLGFMAEGVGSRAAWLVVGTGSAAAAIAVCLALGPEFPAARPAPARQGDDRRPLAWGAIVAYGAAGMGYIIPATYLPVMARATIADPLVFGWSWPVFGTAAFLSTLLAIALRERASNRQVWTASQLVMAAGVVLPALVPHIAAIMVSGLAVGGTFMIVTMLGMKEMHRIAPAADVMRHIGAMTAAFATGQMIGPVFASSLHSLTGNFDLSLLVTGAVLVLTLAGLGARPGENRRQLR